MPPKNLSPIQLQEQAIELLNPSDDAQVQGIDFKQAYQALIRFYLKKQIEKPITQKKEKNND